MTVRAAALDPPASTLIEHLSASGRSVDEVVETHISVLVFSGDRVYKVKKAVDFVFCDLRTVAARRADAVREIELNSRLAPDVYLGLEPIGPGTDDDTAELAVVMRRLDPEHRLARIADAGGGEECVRAVAERVVAFHASLGPSPLAAQVATRDAVLALWETGFDQWRRHRGTLLDAGLVDECETMARRYLAGRGELFASRIAAGHARDGHGDLLADDIFCEPDGPRIIDCLEFDERLRAGDTLLDLAFLAMDLEALGRPDLGATLLARARELTHDPWPATLAHHYIAYRAHVRAKVAGLRAEQGDDEAARIADARLRLTHAHLRRGRVRLVLVGGLPGTGKSTLAAAIGPRLDAVVLRSDVVRKELAGLPTQAHVDADLGTGLYDVASTEATYAELRRRASEHLALGRSVVLDASWSDAHARDAARALAASTVSDLVELVCIAPDEVSRARIVERRRVGDDASDARPEVHTHLATRFTPWPEAMRVDTSRAPALAVARAHTLLDRVDPSAPTI